MSDITIYDEELEELALQVRVLLSALDSATERNRRLEKYNKAQDIMKRLQKTHHQYKVEVRMLENHEKEIYEKRGQTHLETINQLQKELLSKRVETVVGGEAHDNSTWSLKSPIDDGKDGARAAVRRINETQASALESLAVTERLLNETETVGLDAVTKLQTQTEQIRHVNEDVDQLDSEVNRARKELNAFIRRMMTDKIIICFSLLILIGIIVIVALKLSKK